MSNLSVIKYDNYVLCFIKTEASPERGEALYDSEPSDHLLWVVIRDGVGELGAKKKIKFLAER